MSISSASVSSGIADRMVSFCCIHAHRHPEDDIRHPNRILVVGNQTAGAIVRAIRRRNSESFIKAVDPDQPTCNHLTLPQIVETAKEWMPPQVVCRDFLTLSPDMGVPAFTHCLMVCSEARAFQHLHHAMKFLAPGGKAVAVVPFPFLSENFEAYGPVNFFSLPDKTQMVRVTFNGKTQP